jgi:hypothetical protein
MSVPETDSKPLYKGKVSRLLGVGLRNMSKEPVPPSALRENDSDTYMLSWFPLRSDPICAMSDDMSRSGSCL